MGEVVQGEGELGCLHFGASRAGRELRASDVSVPPMVPSPEQGVKEALLTDGPTIFPKEEACFPLQDSALITPWSLPSTHTHLLS